jgi:hypothetical protein
VAQTRSIQASYSGSREACVLIATRTNRILGVASATLCLS